MTASLQSVLDQDRMDFITVASSIYNEARGLCRSGWNGRAFNGPGCWKTSDNLEAELTSQDYQRSIFRIYIDGISSSLRERFNDNPSFLRCFLSCLLTIVQR